MKIQKLVEILNQKEINQDSCWEDCVDPILKELRVEYKIMAKGVDLDKHRWYETSLIVFEIKSEDDTGLMAIRVCTNLFSENSSFSDINWGIVVPEK